MKKNADVKAERPLTNREFKALSAKQKLEYMWKHNRIHVILYAVELLVIVGALLLMFNQKDNTLMGVALNSADSVSAEQLETFRLDLQQGIPAEADKMKVELVTSLDYFLNDEEKAVDNYTVIQILSEQADESALDFLVGDQETVTVLAHSGFFQDLSTVLSEEQLEKYKPYLRYIDQAVIDEIVRAVETSETDVDIQVPDCSKPEEMEKPYPVMIDMSQCESLAALYPDTEEPPVFAVFRDSPSNQITQRVIDQMLTGQEGIQQ